MRCCSCLCCSLWVVAVMRRCSLSALCCGVFLAVVCLVTGCCEWRCCLLFDIVCCSLWFAVGVYIVWYVLFEFLLACCLLRCLVLFVVVVCCLVSLHVLQFAVA